MKYSVRCYRGGIRLVDASFSSLSEAKNLAIQSADSGLFERVALLTDRGDLLEEHFDSDGA